MAAETFSTEFVDVILSLRAYALRTDPQCG
jgi:hypothetical protein